MEVVKRNCEQITQLVARLDKSDVTCNIQALVDEMAAVSEVSLLSAPKIPGALDAIDNQIQYANNVLLIRQKAESLLEQFAQELQMKTERVSELEDIIHQMEDKMMPALRQENESLARKCDELMAQVQGFQRASQISQGPPSELHEQRQQQRQQNMQSISQRSQWRDSLSMSQLADDQTSLQEFIDKNQELRFEIAQLREPSQLVLNQIYRLLQNKLKLRQLLQVPVDFGTALYNPRLQRAVIVSLINSTTSVPEAQKAELAWLLRQGVGFDQTGKLVPLVQ